MFIRDFALVPSIHDCLLNVECVVTLMETSGEDPMVSLRVTLMEALREDPRVS